MTKPPIGHQVLREGRISIPGQYYFITKNARERVGKDWPATRRMAVGRLVQPGVPAIIRDSLAWLEARALIHLNAYCLMPDHLHLLIQLGTDAELSSVIQRFCAHTGRLIAQHTGRPQVWAAAFYEHTVRQEESLTAIADYIHNNPVRAGLVATVYEWPWSSIHRESEE